MWGDGGWGGWIGWLAMIVTMVVFWGGLIAVVVFLVREGSGRRPDREPTDRPDATDILASRFARGEISEEEYEQRRRVLTGSV